MTNPSCKYWAFISYSHRDKAWGDWLHKALETYRVPKALVGKPTSRDYDVPARVFPVFRDREELPTADDLGAVIQNALAQSRFLIVICSPLSAKSMWVNEEIMAFKRLGRENRVLCIIVDGEPNAANGKPGFSPEDECLPEAVRFKLGADGQLTGQPTEPIAADAREGKDGKENALLKLLAGVLGVNFDDLRQREQARQRRRRIATGVGAAVALAVAVGVQVRLSSLGHEKVWQEALASLAEARKSLDDQQPATAASQAMAALNAAESLGRSLEPALWVLRRAVDANRVASRWQAHHSSVSECAFDAAGQRLMTFSSEDQQVCLWSVPDGKRLTSINLPGRHPQLAGWAGGSNELLTVCSIPEGNDDSNVELTWWNPDDGSPKRKMVHAHCNFYQIGWRHIAGLPQWIAANDHANAGGYRLISLLDGRTTLSLPPGDRYPIIVPGAQVVLLPTKTDGVCIFSLSDGRKLGQLAGLQPGQEWDLDCPVASVDGTRFACFVREKSRQREAVVWAAANGNKIMSVTNDLGNFMAGTVNQELVSDSSHLLKVLAPALCRKAVDAPVWDGADAASVHNATMAAPTVASVITSHGKVSQLHPDLGVSTDLTADDTEVIQLSADGQLLALGNSRGEVTLFRTTRSIEPETEVPDSVVLVHPHSVVSDAADRLFFQSSQGGTNLMLWEWKSRRVIARMNVPSTPLTDWDGSWWDPLSALLITKPLMPMTLGPTNFPPEFQTVIYDAVAGKRLSSMPVTGAVLSPRGKQALIWNKQRAFWDLWQLGGDQPGVMALKEPGSVSTNTASEAAFAGDGKQVVIAAAPGIGAVYSAETGSQESMFHFADDVDASINSLIVSGTSHCALVSTYNHCWRVDWLKGTATAVFTNGVPNNCVLLAGEHLLVGEDGADLKWWTFPDLVPVASVHGSFDAQKTVLLESSHEVLLCGRDEALLDQIVIADARTGEVRSRLSKVLAVEAKVLLAVVEVDQGCRLVRLQDGEVLADLPPSESACIAPDGSRVGLVLRGSQRFVTVPVGVSKSELQLLARKQSNKAF